MEAETKNPGDLARVLVAQVTSGTLSSLAVEPAGYPYGSAVTYALDGASPVFLLSALAEHTRNLSVDSRASLLVVEPGEADLLARGRVTLLGRCTALDGAEAREHARSVYLATHPGAARVAAFKDFSFYSLNVEAARFIGGFGRMSWLSQGDWARSIVRL